MLNAAANALSQMMSPPFRAVLMKSAGLAALLLIVLSVALHRIFAAVAASGESWLESLLGSAVHAPLGVLFWILSLAAGLGLVLGAIFLMPTATALVAGLFGDAIAEQVEREYYPREAPGTAPPIARAILEAIRIALMTLLVYVVTVPFLLFAGLGALIFYFANSYLQGRQYFDLVALRFHSPAETKRLRRDHHGTIYLCGMVIAAFLSIPIVNLATPLFGTAFMVHMLKRMTGGMALERPQ